MPNSFQRHAVAALLSMPLLVLAAAPPTQTMTATPASPQAVGAKAPDEQSYVLPGSFRPDDTLASLQQRWGKANVSKGEISGAEGATQVGLVLFDRDPQRRMEIFTRDPDAGKGIDTIRVAGASSKWRLDNGLALGMTLGEVVKLNGKPIRFSGLDWDYGGGISDWNGGRLQPVDKAPIFRSITLTSGEGAGDTYPTGDGDFRSDDPKFPNIGKTIKVGEITVSFVEPDGA